MTHLFETGIPVNTHIKSTISDLGVSRNSEIPVKEKTDQTLLLLFSRNKWAEKEGREPSVWQGPLEQASLGHLLVVKFKTFGSRLSRKFDRFLPTEGLAGNTITLSKLPLEPNRTAEPGQSAEGCPWPADLRDLMCVSLGDALAHDPLS